MSAAETVAIPAERWVPLGWLDLGEFHSPSGPPIRVWASVVFSLLLEAAGDPTGAEVAVPGQDCGWLLETMMPELAGRLKAAMGALGQEFEARWPAEALSVGAASDETRRKPE